ncbi:MAG: hypothetical protein ACOX2O_09190 [Bdellovibrionota bacterium]|jgi:sRNA-binding carbon storage regulator CsrA
MADATRKSSRGNVEEIWLPIGKMIVLIRNGKVIARIFAKSLATGELPISTNAPKEVDILRGELVTEANLNNAAEVVELVWLGYEDDEEKNQFGLIASESVEVKIENRPNPDLGALTLSRPLVSLVSKKGGITRGKKILILVPKGF